MELRAYRSIILIFLILLINSASLHLQKTQNTQLQALKEKQQLLRDQLKALNAYSADIQTKLLAAGSDEQRIQILQAALVDERQTVFDLKNKIISPFNESQTACTQLDDKQKQSLLQKLATNREELKKLQEINSKLNQSSAQVQGVNDSIQKELVLLANLEDILKTKCKENLSPTIFQSNLNAKNWILGPQTMRDLEEEYAERAFIFHNITNCPLSTPFFDPSSASCINCSDPNPLFNMYAKECTACDKDEQVFDDKNKVCKPMPHYTNFTKAKNWDLEGGSLPAVDSKLTPCPDAKPYYNGVVCVACELPQYWSVLGNLCKTCPSSQAFDINTKKCEKILKHQLTILQNTNWVSQNLTQVLENRTIALQKNKTAKNYEYCPSNTPYFDGTTCINCDYFDIDRSRCVSKPAGKQYNTNMRRFLAPQSQVQTDPNAPRYVSNANLADSDKPNCNSSLPYFDGMACIQCQKPFDIFNVDEKKCISCNNDEIFTPDIHKCSPRRRILISQNFDRLLATPKVDVPQYKESLIKIINDDPQAIVSPCTDKKHYSNLSNCFFCQDNEYFNVETLQCQLCDGVYVVQNQTCKANVYIFTNLKAPRIVDMDGTTMDKQNDKISQFLRSHPESYICPIDTPYAIGNTTCGTCADLFSYKELQCKSCSEWNIYVPDTRKCVQAKMIVNFTDEGNFLVSENETLASFKSQQQQVQNANPNIWKLCPGDRPYTDNSRESCFSCSGDQPYFNYTARQCQNCPAHTVFDKQTSMCLKQYYITLINADTQQKMIGYDNYTIEDFKKEEDAVKEAHPVVQCEEGEPFGTATGCMQCNQPAGYFDVRQKVCSEVKYLINFQKMSPNYILPKDKSLDVYVAEQENYRKSSPTITKKCPDNTPYTSDHNSCFNCDQGKYFVLQRKSCQACPQGQQFVYQAKSCKKQFYVSKITTFTEPYMKGYPDYTLDDYKKELEDMKAKNPFKQCPDSTPYGSENGCQQCSQPTPYFDIKKKVCSNAKKLINFSTVGENYLVADNKTLEDYKTNQNNFMLYSQSLTVQCPPQTPFTSDRDTCFVCKDPDNLFNFQTKRCEACRRGASFSNEKKQCLKLFYITNFNPESEKMMVGTAGYGVEEYKADEEKNKDSNPYEECSESEPYGTENGCRKCSLPQEYFDIKTKTCVAVKKTINFDSIGQNYILAQGKSLSDYQKDQQNFESSSLLPIIHCPAETPFTNNHDECFACPSDKTYFNFDLKQCQSCESNSAYDPNTRRCVKILYYTLLDETTEANLIESGEVTISDYKTAQQTTKSQPGSAQCPSTTPYATAEGCIECQPPTPYFNVQSQSCQGCLQLYQYFQDHQCKNNTVLTNTKKMVGYFEVDNYTKYNVEKMNNFTYLNKPHVVDCPADKPFSRKDNVCIACDTSDLPIFNLKDRACMYVQSFVMSNPDAMKNYIESGDSTLEGLRNEIDVLSKRGVKLNICPANLPYLSQNQCITCPDTNKYFDLGTQICRTCQPGQNCVSV